MALGTCFPNEPLTASEDARTLRFFGLTLWIPISRPKSGRGYARSVNRRGFLTQLGRQARKRRSRHDAGLLRKENDPGPRQSLFDRAGRITQFSSFPNLRE